jgi:hypothetical protein
MAEYTLPAPGNSRPTVESLEGRLLAIEPSDVNERPTRFGDKLIARARVAAINSDGSTEEVDDDFMFAQMVLVEELQRVLKKQQGWLVARIIRPGKAWLFEAPEADELDLVDKVMADITVGDEAF